MKYTEQEPAFSRSKILSNSVNNYQAESLSSVLEIDQVFLNGHTQICMLSAKCE
jgi:hypothetical protein